MLGILARRLQAGKDGEIGVGGVCTRVFALRGQREAALNRSIDDARGGGVQGLLPGVPPIPYQR